MEKLQSRNRIGSRPFSFPGWVKSGPGDDLHVDVEGAGPAARAGHGRTEVLGVPFAQGNAGLCYREL